MVYQKQGVTKRWLMALVVLGVVLTLCLTGCNRQGGGENMTFSTEYQAVFMENGQVFFGKLENMGSAYPLLKNVFYIRQQVNPETKEVKQVLIRRGNELHRPNQMYINASHIAIIEPVSADSQVAKLIKEAEAQKPSGGQ